MPRHSESTLAAIKQAVDIVTLVGEYLPIHRAGSKFKALCPFHDDHNPSMELNPDRQSFKCWSCGAGGDIFDFVKDYERVDFPEALRMLADRAGVALGEPEAPAAPGLAKVELFEVTAWAESAFAEASRSRPTPAPTSKAGGSRRPRPPASGWGTPPNRATGWWPGPARPGSPRRPWSGWV